MALFGKKEENGGGHKTKRSLTDYVIIGFLIMIFIQIFGLLTNAWFNSGIYLGPGFLVFLIAASVLLSFAFAANWFKQKPIDKKDVVVLIIVFSVTILALIYLRPLVPEIFRQSMMSLKTNIQSTIPLP